MHDSLCICSHVKACIYTSVHAQLLNLINLICIFLIIVVFLLLMDFLMVPHVFELMCKYHINDSPCWYFHNNSIPLFHRVLLKLKI